MTYYDIIDAAISAACEDAGNTSATGDYLSRSQFLLANFVTQYAKLDALVREADGLEPKTVATDIALVDPEDDFPLCDIFAPVAVLYLAAALVLDENEEMSDRLFDRYINGILEIRNTLPAKQGAIVDKYGLD